MEYIEWRLAEVIFKEPKNLLILLYILHLMHIISYLFKVHSFRCYQMNEGKRNIIMKVEKFMWWDSDKMFLCSNLLFLPILNHPIC